ncbi:MAG: thermonuclease family protein [Oscillospiraceae bacterium]|nr:thermonuclease family protein [Oscillospiraceae bacterium]
MRKRTGKNISSRRRRKRTLLRLLVLLLLLLSAALCLRPELFPEPVRAFWEILFPSSEQRGELKGPYTVVYVYDGDTINVRIGEEEHRVRLIGVDAPESVHWDASKNTEEGKQASQWLRDRLNNSRVYLEFDEQREDRYDRLLAYVWLSDGETLVEDELLRGGMAQIMPMEPNDRYAARFEKLELEAKRSGAGFWGTGFFK